MSRQRDRVDLPSKAQLQKLGEAMMAARACLSNTARGLEAMPTDTPQLKALVALLRADIAAALAYWDRAENEG